ncbi:hypothetical protein GBA52_004973 [Prunus armeniaca]|nr:hypothetical protein GBA52_004973 [Prunus armeniaca]
MKLQDDGSPVLIFTRTKDAHMAHMILQHFLHYHLPALRFYNGNISRTKNASMFWRRA